ncbi:acetyl-/propionyl-CoA carboxylase subunit alpha, partial [Kocuria tytonicola]|uniref:biotin/lipoyl-containing protein n=1 Tax=Kocuria tytonicola TaxID=2055946 RepID=UPI000F1DEB5C
PGTVETFEAPTGAGVRVDTGVRSGSTVPAEYDSLLAKLIVWGEDRQQALVRSRAALKELTVRGLPTVVPFHRAVLEESAFTSGDGLGVWTTWIEDEFAAELEASPHLTPDAAGRTTVTLDVDGRAVRVGLPGDLADALLRGGGPGGAASDGGGTAASSSPPDDAALTAPMNGTVVAWLVEDGENVEEGQCVLVVEAMKMETPVRAHRSGTLRHGEIVKGDAVRAGQSLGEIA